MINVLLATVIMILAGIESRLGNRLFYSMHDRFPIRAGLYDFLADIEQLTIGSWIAVYLIITQDILWSAIFILSKALGSSAVTWWDVRSKKKGTDFLDKKTSLFPGKNKMDTAI